MQSYDYYIDAYPDGPNKVLNFLTYDLLLTLQLDHIYRCGLSGGVTAEQGD